MIEIILLVIAIALFKKLNTLQWIILIATFCFSMWNLSEQIEQHNPVKHEPLSYLTVSNEVQK